VKVMRGRATKWAVVAARLGVLCAVLVSSTVSASTPTPPFIAADSDWLTTVNYYRAMSGVGPVVENAMMSAGATAHSCYMLYNGISHSETPGLTGYTPEGDLAARNGNVAVFTEINVSARRDVETWMTGPFHAISVLRPNLRSSGFGKCDLADTPSWHSSATLDVVRGIVTAPRPPTPILFPGDGTTTDLDRFITESPNPLTFCGWSGPAGLPIIAMMPEVATGATAIVTGPTAAIEVCVLSAANTTGTAQQILAGDNAVVVVPRTVLNEGRYDVTVDTTARNVSWSFTVDPAAATASATQPATAPASVLVSVAQPTGPASGFAPVPPARIADTRVDLGAAHLNPHVPRRVQVTGTAGVPADANAVLANVTVTGPSDAGFLTTWNCSATQPVVSTLNFSANETVANAATVPLDGSGGLCAVSTASADLVIDVNGYYSPSAPGRYMPVTPRRLMDSRYSARLHAGTIVELPVINAVEVPSTATAVALNVTAVLPSRDGFVTTYPCGGLPATSSLNPAAGQITPNFVMAPVSASGTVCLFTNVDVDLVVDVMGYIASAATTKLTPTTPFRFTDTRDQSRVEVNAGQSGRLEAGQTITVAMAGQRGLPVNARAVSANLTVVDATSAGFLTAFPCGNMPTASNINYQLTAAIANAAELPLSATGTICIYSSAAAEVIIDVNGWWS
jgi:Cysteine-rich secretory protein family